MEVAESKSPTQQEDSPSSSEIYEMLAEAIEDKVKDILGEIEEDENFSEMTAESYDYKKSYLRRHLTGLSRLHRLLAHQHVRLIEEVSKNCPPLIKNQHLDSSDSSFPQFIDIVLKASGGGFDISYKLPSSPVKDDALEVKETKVPEHLLEKNSNVVDEPISDKRLPGDEATKMKQKFQETEKFHLELQKQVADLKLVISESDLRIRTMEKELEKSQKSLSIAKDTISNLKGEKSSKIFQQNQMLKHELQSAQELLSISRKQFQTQLENFHTLQTEVESCVAEISMRDDQIKELNTKNDLYKSEISKLEETLKSKERIWSNDVAKLKGQLKDQSKLFDDSKKLLNSVRSDKNRISTKLETLKDERCSQGKLIQELETRLNTLQVEHGEALSSFDNAEKLNNELTLKVVELEREVDRHREDISVTKEEKKEAIRQLSFALEHYMSKYKQLRQSSVANQTGCFGFQSCLNTL